ncbi:MAG: putative bifunctional diguanylate cyclase/phosphodiesterase [Bacteroidota bacterium]
MKADRRDFAADYEQALLTYLQGGDEEIALQQAYELGRRAIAGEENILGLIGIHYRVQQITGRGIKQTPRRQQRETRSEAFLAQVMALFEMTHRQTQEMNRSLRNSERRKAAILTSAFDSIITFDAHGRIIDFNPAAEAMFGHQRAGVIGHDLAALILPESRRAAFHETLELCRAPGDEPSIGQRQEIVAVRADGSEFPAEMAITYVKVDAAGFFTAYVRDLTERKIYEARIEYLATHDALTSLANRNLLKDRIEHTIAHAARHGDQALIVLFIGIERFKFINDSMGHAFGDALIKAIAHRLESGVRDIDTLARQSSDEFVIALLGNGNGVQDALRCGGEVLAAFTRPFAVEERSIHMGCSIGVSLYPSDGKEVDTLIDNASAAMHRAKASGNGMIHFYTPDLSAFAAERARLENALWSGLGNDEFRVYYQPQIRVADGAIIGAEALIRWQHPQLGMISPERFVGLAEETGLITQIGEWVLETACTQNRIWQNQGFPELRIAVNVSARQFRNGSIMRALKTVLSGNGLSPGSLEIEVTESSLMDNMDESILLLNEMRALGISISLDDFGTGYSSLSYLRRLPVDRLKIDQSFVHGMRADAQAQTMVREIIHLAQAFGLSIIAEGVETQRELDFIRRHGCDEYQGYLFSKPVPVDEFEHLLRSARRARQEH